jgi:hypothetical protein
VRNNDNTRNEQIPSILVEGNPSALKWYDIIGHWKRRHETAKVKKRFKKRSGYVIRRRACDFSVSDVVLTTSTSLPNNDSSLDERSSAKSNVYVDELSEDDDFQKVRLQKWMKNGITHKSLEMTAADIHKKYTIDIMSGASDESD